MNAAMPSHSPKTFRVTLEAATGLSLHWTIARIPVDLKKAWPGWGSRRVIGEINGFPFRTSLFPGPEGRGLTLLVNKRMQKGAKAGPGTVVQIRLEPDMGPIVIGVPKELTAALKADRKLMRWFELLSPSMRKGVSFFVDQAKGAETRTARAERIAEGLMLAMEGEKETPPILRAAFQRQPMAQQGWNAMTPTQRKNHLLGIFFVQTVDGREKRVARAVQDALRKAQKGNKQRRQPDDN
jgi:uncharacterized protein YdeI (YjbR/CyaY-like superfamily)